MSGFSAGVLLNTPRQEWAVSSHKPLVHLSYAGHAGHLTVGSAFFLFVAVGLALAFEFVNGFHDTANAVATVIYTRTLRPNVAVIWSGIFNLLGVLSSSGAVAFGVVSLL